MLAICWPALGGALALGCTPKIGDDCSVSTNCSTTGDRLCDVTQPGGYCTKFNCEPGSCPEDSVCVNFGTKLSPIPGCAPSQANSPYKRSFCMASCSSDGDCRESYRCLAPTEFNAVLAEHSSGNKVCAVPPKPVPSGTSNEVCIGSDAGPGPAQGGASSTAGAGGDTGGGGSGSAEGGAAGESAAAGEGGSGG
jgi:hypothetical protein